MNVLSLFDGMSCFQIALERAEIKVDNYFASEIDKHAIKVTQANYPVTIQIGDVRQVNAKDLPKIDILCGGSPCQGFSFAGKQLAFEDERSKLFFEYVRVLNEIKLINPNVIFLLENVRMKREYENAISSILKVKPIMIDSALVSAQSRKRLYWTNIANQSDGLFNENICTITQPINKKIFLKDILEDEVDVKYNLSKSMVKRLDSKGEILQRNRNKAKCFTAGGNSGGLHSDMTVIFQLPRGKNEGGFHNKKSPTLSSNSFEQNNVVISGRWRQFNNEGLREIKSGKAGSILARCREDGGNQNAVYTKGIYRRLTSIECERLQTVPDNYTNYVSDSQRYKMLGNGFTVDVIAHILKYYQGE